MRAARPIRHEFCGCQGPSTARKINAVPFNCFCWRTIMISDPGVIESALAPYAPQGTWPSSNVIISLGRESTGTSEWFDRLSPDQKDQALDYALNVIATNTKF